jgi:hypothetical protein
MRSFRTSDHAEGTDPDLLWIWFGIWFGIHLVPRGAAES